MNYIVYHKRDLDGKCSGAIAVKWHEEENLPYELIPYDYGEPFPWDKITKADTVYMLDVSLQPYEEMYKLNSLCTLVWCDHHKSALEAFPPKTFAGKQEVGVAGCELTWRYFYPDAIMPIAVYLLGRYDVWDNKDEGHWNHHILPFQYGLRSVDNRPESKAWEPLLNHSPFEVQAYKERGGLLLDYQKGQNKGYALQYAFPAKIAGYDVIAINHGFGSSQLFEAIWDPMLYDFMCAFAFNGSEYKVSLYTDKPDRDASVIAVAFGGGGHQGAAGFRTKELPFQFDLQAMEF